MHTPRLFPDGFRMPGAAVLRESTRTALSQRISSGMTVAIIAALCCVVLLSTGRAVGAENTVLTSIDTTGTRSIIVRATAVSGLDTTVLSRLADVGSIDWAGAFGPASDVVNAAFTGGAHVPLRLFHPGVWGAPSASACAAACAAPSAAACAAPSAAACAAPSASACAAPSASACAAPSASTSAAAVHGASPRPSALPLATADAAAAHALGLSDGVGTVIPPGGGPLTDVVRVADPPTFLSFLEPSVLISAPASTPAPAPTPAPVAVLVVLARTSAQVAPLAAVVSSLLDVRDTSTVTVTTSAQLAALHDVVQEQLGGFSQSLVAIVFGATSLVVASMLHALVMLRRRDFGRRRALGATRMLVAGLLLVQVALLAGVGAALGSGAASVALLVLGDPLPTPQFFAALAVLAVLTALVSAVVPAVVASRRDPLRELRVP